MINEEERLQSARELRERMEKEIRDAAILCGIRDRHIKEIEIIEALCKKHLVRAEELSRAIDGKYDLLQNASEATMGDVPKRPQVHVMLTAEQKELIAMELKDGLSHGKIAKDAGCSISLVEYYSRKFKSDSTQRKEA